MMNDGGVLVSGVEAASPLCESFAGGTADVALTELDARFKALRRGQVHTNSDADQKYFDKVLALGTYALADSPLVTAFTREDETPSAFLKESDHN
jgi:hypothetical protein